MTRPTGVWSVRRAPRIMRSLILASVATALSACSDPGVIEDVEAERDATQVVATVEDEPVTMADVRELAGTDLGRLEYQYRRQRHAIIEAATRDAVRRRLLTAAAEERGISVEELVEEKTGDLPEVTEEDVTNWYRMNAASLGGMQLEDIRPRIREFLEERQRERILDEFTSQLEAQRDVEIELEPFRVEFDNEGAPALGPEDAPVTLVEFSDFECPYCGRFFETVNRLKEEYGERLRVVYRHYPLESHPHAFEAARASMCAADQGRFWEMHDRLFEGQDELTRAGLLEKAERLDLDIEEFEECLASDRYTERIERDMREGNRVGVEGTPAVFVNGIPVPGGAVPYEMLAAMIEEELEREGEGS